MRVKRSGVHFSPIIVISALFGRLLLDALANYEYYLLSVITITIGRGSFHFRNDVIISLYNVVIKPQVPTAPISLCVSPSAFRVLLVAALPSKLM